MVKIIWTKTALKDLESIHDFIAKDSEFHAIRFVQLLFERTFTLKEFPLSGRLVPEIDSTLIRELIEGNYRIIYRNRIDKNVSVLRIHHSARLLK